MTELRRQLATVTHPIAFYMVDSSTKLGKTSLTPTVTLSKNGGTFNAAAGAVTELGSGWYQLAGNATDRNTLGALIVHAAATGADASDSLYEIVDYDPYAALGAYAGYGSLVGVAALAQMWTRNGIWVNTVPAYGPTAEVKGTNPSLTQVTTWLTGLTAMVDIALAGEGFTVPIVQATALETTNMFVDSLVADLCHAANSSGRLYAAKVIERGLSPLILVNQQISNWAKEWTAGFRRLGVPWSQQPVEPAFTVEARRQP